MLQELTIEEMFIVEGGVENPIAYELGHSIGHAVSAFIAAYGIYALF